MKDKLADAFLSFLHSFAAVLPVHAPPWEIIGRPSTCIRRCCLTWPAASAPSTSTHSPFLNFFPFYGIKAARQRRSSSNAG